MATQEAEKPLATAVLLPSKPAWERALKSSFHLHSRWRQSEEEASGEPAAPSGPKADDSSSGSSTPSDEEGEPEYALLCTAAMGGCHLAIFVRRRLLPRRVVRMFAVAYY